MAAIRNEPGLDELPTEDRDPAGADLDLRSTAELVRLMGEADATVPAVVLSVVALVLLALSGWLGGKLAYRYGVRVADETTQEEGFAHH